MATTALKIVSRKNTTEVYSEFWTPTHILESVYEVLRTVELDPACNMGEPWVRAERYYTKDENGLLQPWVARTLFLNPPYGNDIGHWTRKLTQAYRDRTIQEAILLVPGKVETRWFQPLAQRFMRCEVRGRLKFVTPYGKTGVTQQLFGSVLFYMGENRETFARVFSKIGSILVPYAPMVHDRQL